MNTKQLELRVTNNAMEPEYLPGDIVRTDPSIEPQDGDAVLATCANQVLLGWYNGDGTISTNKESIDVRAGSVQVVTEMRRGRIRRWDIENYDVSAIVIFQPESRIVCSVTDQGETDHLLDLGVIEEVKPGGPYRVTKRALRPNRPEEFWPPTSGIGRNGRRYFDLVV